MHDTVIRGGTIIDGTGQAAFTGDVALKDGKIAQVGGKARPAKRVMDANGLSTLAMQSGRLLIQRPMIGLSQNKLADNPASFPVRFYPPVRHRRRRPSSSEKG